METVDLLLQVHLIGDKGDREKEGEQKPSHKTSQSSGRVRKPDVPPKVSQAEASGLYLITWMDQ